jgi:hypothetical protein
VCRISRLFLSKLETWLMSKLVRPSLSQPGWLMLDSRVVDVRVLETHHIPFPNLCQESDLAGPYQKSDRLINVREFCGAYNSQPVKCDPHQGWLRSSAMRMEGGSG